MNAAARKIAFVGVCALACHGGERPLQRGDPEAGPAGGKQLLPTEPTTVARILKVSVDSLGAAADEAYQREAYDSAEAILDAELVRARRVRDRKAEARARMLLGMASWRLGDYKRARIEGELAVQMTRSLGMGSELSRSFNALGLVAWNEGRERDALQLFDSAVAAANRNHDSTGIARAAANIPLVKKELGDFDGARRGFDVALPAARAINNDKMIGNDLANLAALDIAVGDASTAITMLDSARSRYRAINYRTGEANALGQLATAWAQLGDLQRAITAADSALTIARSEGLSQEVAAELEVIADLEVRAGDNKLALRHLALADSIDAQLGLATERGINMRRIATILMAVGDTNGSVSRARQALAVHQNTEAKEEIVYDRLQLAQSLSGSGAISPARVELDSALAEARKTNDRALTGDVENVAARVSLGAHDAKRAIEILGRSPRSELSDWETSDLRAQALFALGRVDDARLEETRAIAGLERERASLGFGPLRSGYLADRVSPYAHLVAIEIARHDTASAFAAAASVPGRSLTERLAAIAHPTPSIAAIAENERLLAREASLENQLSELGTEATVAERRASLQHALDATRAEYSDNLSRSATLSAINTMRPRLADVQSRLASTEALIVFLSGPDRLDEFVVTQAHVTFRAIPLGSADLRTRVRALRDVLNSSAADAARNSLGAMHRQLLGTSIPPNVNRLVIVPHGALAAFPFAALWNQSSGRYAIEDYSITTLPAIAALARCCDNARVQLDRPLVLAPLSNELPGTRREALAIAQAIPTAEVKLGTASNKRIALDALAAGRPLHIASHGSHDRQSPLFSRMVVGVTSRKPGASDALLEVHEILGLSTVSPLVYLSGCETALGGVTDNAFVASDENSLAESFLIAGARTVVASLWHVDDAAAAGIAENFYSRLKGGASPDDALAYAQRNALKHARSFTWASYTVATSQTRAAATSH